MDEVKLRLSDIKQRAKARPEVNLEEFLAMGRTEGDFFFIARQKYGEVLKQYNSRIEQSSCCQTKVMPRQEATSSFKPATWTQKAKNFGNAVVDTTARAIRGEPVYASNDVVNSRKSICETCEHLKGSTCELCGCYYPAKVRLEGQECPRGYW